MAKKQSILSPIIRITFTFLVLCGLVYPLIVTGIAQAVMKDNADGSLIYNDKDEVVGSKLIGQNFTDPRYFHGRVSSIEYKAEASGSNNYAPSNPDLAKRVEKSIDDWKKQNRAIPVTEVPIDLVTNSGSGLDPDISPKAASVQVDRISKLTNIPKEKLDQLIKDQTEGAALGLFGEDRVNVLKLNLELQKLMK
ncbi:K(+)-transporting ATPase subunit C [Bacillus sp. TH22]|jgi:K+-transporting ATPase ATPase C chain|uniref:Potassium-transporting ATPase KdpC subunit n=3 Tax=Bacillus cereus group TaxID=86661 RepID=KDPC_BACMK|nr:MULTISPECIES: K(+)-transporting ATPase subunit C [Bacillus]A9VFM2.1 RecName: Full=Potassium-transporting ATPase KdpC subunit; AltName: Full=ATP phosphohydrolase [potassium-transporting] C chain; AltName: Full=Potassium-binding and translocating subunit C; AltName: Full=Potassium-translocating ATPase C chain [Bacillus mycoides KBAB4]EJS10804.1 potassium-transporting ATPase C chain [Bacillus cereus VDM034]EJS12491.1 potassium-transporting ATPase C chain [Bacillus cereus VDM062]MBK5360827.1 K(+